MQVLLYEASAFTEKCINFHNYYKLNHKCFGTDFSLKLTYHSKCLWVSPWNNLMTMTNSYPKLTNIDYLLFRIRQILKQKGFNGENIYCSHWFWWHNLAKQKTSLQNVEPQKCQMEVTVFIFLHIFLKIEKITWIVPSFSLRIFSHAIRLDQSAQVKIFDGL